MEARGIPRELFKAERDVVATYNKPVELLFGAGFNRAVGSGRQDNHCNLRQIAGADGLTMLGVKSGIQLVKAGVR